MMYFKGDGADQDLNKALGLWHKAADEEHPAAMGLLGRAYMEGKMGFEKDAASGLALLEKGRQWREYAFVRLSGEHLRKGAGSGAGYGACHEVV